MVSLDMVAANSGSFLFGGRFPAGSGLRAMGPHIPEAVP
jgi:hypothetical protein